MISTLPTLPHCSDPIINICNFAKLCQLCQLCILEGPVVKKQQYCFVYQYFLLSHCNLKVFLFWKMPQFFCWLHWTTKTTKHFFLLLSFLGLDLQWFFHFKFKPRIYRLLKFQVSLGQEMHPIYTDFLHKFFDRRSMWVYKK